MPACLFECAAGERRDKACVVARACAEAYPAPGTLAVHHYTFSWYERYVEQMAALDVRL